jgi:hypothetical protein
VPSAHAHLHEDDEIGAEDLSGDERPILLADIDRVLGESAVLERTRGASPVRVWRDELTLVLESLAYARSVLAADVAILRHCLTDLGPDLRTVVDDLPAIMTTPKWRASRSESREADDEGVEDPGFDLAVFLRSDRLVAAHEHMARTDLSSPEDVGRALRELEAELSELTARQEAVEVRLQQIRVAIIRQYQEREVRTRDWLG